MKINRTGNKQGGTFKCNSLTEVTPNQMRSSACKMVRTLVQFMRTLDRMPEERTILMKLFYYDDVTPVDYKHPFFRSCTEQEAHNPWTKNPLKMELGYVNSKHFVLALKVKSVLDPCEDENYDIQDDDVSLGADSVERDEHSESDSEVSHSQDNECIVAPIDDATFGSPTRMGKGLTCVCFKSRGTYERICINLTPLQEERLRRLKHRMKVNFDASRVEHQEGLKALWSATYPGQELHGLVSDQWKEMGWQGKDPSTDFRGAGFISLENLLFFAKTFSTSFQCLLKKQGGKRAAWEYPFAVAGVNITFMIMQMLDLDATKPRTFVRTVFLQMLSENEWAFDLLYCVAFVVMDKQWLEKNATYMQFNDVLKSTRAQLEKELLMDDVLRIEDMPSYTLLF